MTIATRNQLTLAVSQPSAFIVEITRKDCDISTKGCRDGLRLVKCLAWRLTRGPSLLRALNWALASIILLLALLPACYARELRVVGASFSQIFERRSPDITPSTTASPPLSAALSDSSSEFFGLGVDIINAFAKEQGHTVKYELLPWMRAQTLVQQGKADILIGPYKNPQRLQRLAFSDQAFYLDRMVFYVNASSSITWNGDLSSLTHFQIGKVFGWSYGNQFDALASQLTLYDFVRLEGGLRRLALGSIDLFASNERNTNAILDKASTPYQVKSIEPMISAQSGYFAFPKTAEYDTIRSQFDQYFATMAASGELATFAKMNHITIPPILTAIEKSPLNETRGKTVASTEMTLAPTEQQFSR